MPTTLLPLTGAPNFSNGFSLEPAVPDDFGEAMYDLRRLLLGEHGYETEISAEIRKQNPALAARGKFVPWQLFSRSEGSLRQHDVTAGGATTGSSFVQVERLPDIASALIPVSQVVASARRC
jgi:hypothetical protein